MDQLIGGGAPQGKGAGGSGAIKDVSTASFAKDVIEASMQAPVIVDFWAPWCGPCKQLAPALERSVAATKGAVRLAKVNIDENQALAQQLRIQSIPTVYAFYQGRPVDGFQGNVPESEVKAFVGRLTELAGAGAGDEAAALEAALAQAEEAVAKGDHRTAGGIYAQIVQLVPDNLKALAGLLAARIALGDVTGAQQQFDALPAATKEKPELAAIKTQLELAVENARLAGQLGELQAKVAADANDHQARFDLAGALLAKGDKEAAADQLLEIVLRKRDWNEEAARKQLVKYFEAWGPSDPATLSARRRLSSLLFS